MLAWFEEEALTGVVGPGDYGVPGLADEFGADEGLEGEVGEDLFG